MTSSASLTQKWLRQNVQSYLHKDQVFTDVDAALVNFTTLRPKTDVYTYDDGRTQLLLCVHGVLPITFRKATYNIPIAVWITRDYPKDPPIAYVVPTNDMLVKPGRYVDVSGRCSPEYVRNWERKSEGCNLMVLLEALQDQFSREPPLFSKPRGGVGITDQPSPPPLDRPAVPPKPRPSLSPTPTHHPSPSRLTHVSFSGPPPIPPPVPPSGHLLPQYKIPARTSPQVAPSQMNASSSQPEVSYQTTDFTPGAGSEQINHQGTAPAVTSLLDEDTLIVQPIQQAPPRPPNPELLQLHSRVHDKIKLEITTLSQVLASDAERLRTLQTDLLAGEPAIRDEMGRLEAVRDVCRTVGSRLHRTVDQAEKNISELRKRGDPDIDEMVCATSIVHNQLINLVAEDNAIEDTIYQLHRALNAGRIDLDRFLRTIRVLAEEQFMKRALIEKITIGMPKNRSGGTDWS